MIIKESNTQVGLGDLVLRFEDAQPIEVTVYTANRPPVAPFDIADGVIPLEPADVAYIAQMTGNHWRKVFNVYAKLIHYTFPFYDAWQTYRDYCLLQIRSGTRLLYSAPKLNQLEAGIHLVMGKQFAEQCGLGFDDISTYQQLSPRLFKHKELPLWVTPYFDYRQLNNEQIEILGQSIRHYCKQQGMLYS
ncbi:DUF6942 family protein [Bermanella sp. R86510]|uniref:DUF6942 family protein n=1 Tax=unclassified Bermanella TaxID=2627862 RepID=UPI0037C997E3